MSKLRNSLRKVIRCRAAIEYYSSGYGRSESACRSKITLNELNYVLSKRKIVSHYYNKIVDPSTIREIKRKYNKGSSSSELSVEYGVSVSTIYRYLKYDI